MHWPSFADVLLHPVVVQINAYCLDMIVILYSVGDKSITSDRYASDDSFSSSGSGAYGKLSDAVVRLTVGMNPSPLLLLENIIASSVLSILDAPPERKLQKGRLASELDCGRFAMYITARKTNERPTISMD